MKRILLTLTCILTFYSNIQAQFSGSGSGTEADPYRIFNAEQLNQVRNLSSKGVYFSLEADIDMTDWIAENNPSQGWLPISNFRGVFKGNGHKIINLMINRPETDNIGLFGVTEYCNISNVIIKNADYTGNSSIGGLVGSADTESIIDSCSFFGKISANGDNVGGIIGKAVYGEVTFCIFIGNIMANNNVGGIVGYVPNGGIKINNCYSDLTISGKDALGGIIGHGLVQNGLPSSLTNSYSNVNINGNEKIGGIIGNACGYSGNNDAILIQNTYSTGTIRGVQDIGGIGAGIRSGGSTNNYITIDKSYSNCNEIAGKANVNGLIATQTGVKCLITSNFAINNKISADEKLCRVGSENMQGCTPATSTENKAWALTRMILNDEVMPALEDNISNGTNIGISALKLKLTYQGLGWDFDNDWEMQETETFPYLKTQTAPPYFKQTLKAGDTHLEGSCVEVGTIIVRVGDKTFSTQSTGNTWSIDIDRLKGGECVMITAQAEDKFPSYVVSVTVGYTGEGTESSPYLVSTADELHNIKDDGYYKLTKDIDVSEWIENNNIENGWTPIGGKWPSLAITLDGDGHTITGLTFNDNYEYNGLFTKISKYSTVKNLKIELALEQAEVNNNFGTIAGLNRGVISNCKVSGEFPYCHMNFGGIACESTGTIERCYTTGSINIFFLHSPYDEGFVGGICGDVIGGNIINCYSDMDIETSTCAHVGGIAGENGGIITNCYASGTIGGYYYVGGIVGYQLAGSYITPNINGCFALNPKIEAAHTAQRVLGGYKVNPPRGDNYAIKSMVVSVGGEIWNIYDDPLNGTAMTETELKTQVAYENAGWDFENVWKIDEETSWPYQEAFNVPVTSISVSETEANIEAGKTLELTVTIAPDDARNKTVTWSSSDETVATVSQEGTVTAVKAGEATITATTNDGTGLTASCIVKVNETSGIGNVYADGVTVAGGKGCITISGTADNIMTSVYTANGTTVYTGTDTTISVGAPGLYIVKTDGNTYKVIVK